MTERPPWHEDDAFWAAFEEFLFPPEKLEEASEQVDRLLALLDLEPDARVLDVPCGVGRHAVELARRGFRVTAVDSTDAFLETARERARDANVDVEFALEDMREFSVSHRLYSAFELSELLERVGFEDVTVYGSLDGDDYDENAKRLVVVART